MRSNIHLKNDMYQQEVHYSLARLLFQIIRFTATRSPLRSDPAVSDMRRSTPGQFTLVQPTATSLSLVAFSLFSESALSKPHLALALKHATASKRARLSPPFDLD
jgi:hypothetical protein